MALSDIYNIIHRQTNAGESLINVYQVERTSPSFVAANITQAFQDSIMLALAAVQSLSVAYVEVFAANLDDPTDFDTRIQTGQAGTHTGANAPTSLASEIRFPRERTDMRDGFKRWGGITETMYTGQTYESAYQSLLATLGTALTLEWEEAAAPGVAVCNYVIVKRICTVQPPPTPCPSYRLPESGDPLTIYKPLSFQVKSTVRTQVSRRVPA